MSVSGPVEISCPACGRDTLLLRAPLYEGFKKTGESLSCASCGHVFPSSEDVPYKHAAKISIFTDADRSASVKVFDETAAPFCRHCVNYVVNPFTQWCGLHRKEVAATDHCDQFTLRPDEKEC